MPFVLLSGEYWYFGKTARVIPSNLRDCNGEDICCDRQGHKSTFSQEIIDSFTYWIRSLDEKGYIGEPAEFSKELERTRYLGD